MKARGTAHGTLSSSLLKLTLDDVVKLLLGLTVALESCLWSQRSGVVQRHRDCAPQDKSYTLSSIEYNSHIDFEGHLEREDIESFSAGNALGGSVSNLANDKIESYCHLPHATEVL